MLRKIKIALPIFIASMLFVVNSANALEVVDPTPAAAIEYDEAVTVNSSLSATLPSYFFQGTHIGRLDGTGGVLFANGTIVNISRTVEDSNPIPVTFGDDVRIDGEIWRGLYKGTAIDNMPLKISDTMVPTMDDINDLGDSYRRWQDLYLSGMLQGVDAIFSGLISVKDATFTGDVDFTNATVTGISGADLLATENTWTAKNTFSDIEYDSSQTRFWSLNPANMISFDESQAYSKNYALARLYMDSGLGSFTHTINLPNGAELDKFSFGFIDSVGGANLIAMIMRTENEFKASPSAPVTVATINSDSTVDSSVPQNESVSITSDNIVDNSLYNYTILVLFSTASSSLVAGSIEIEYSVAIPLP